MRAGSLRIPMTWVSILSEVLHDLPKNNWKMLETTEKCILKLNSA